MPEINIRIQRDGEWQHVPLNRFTLDELVAILGQVSVADRTLLANAMNAPATE